MISDGPPRRVLELAAQEEIELIVPDLVVSELGRILGGKLGLGADAFRRVLELLGEAAAIQVATPVGADPLRGDSADDRILAAALAAGADVLVSGDSRHLLPLGEIEGMRIVRPQELLAELAG